MTPLLSPISRLTSKTYQGRPVVVTLSPLGGQCEAIIGFRLKGKRTTYTLALSDAYRIAALAYGQRLATAKRAARKAGVPWKQAKRQFGKAVFVS